MSNLHTLAMSINSFAFKAKVTVEAAFSRKGSDNKRYSQSYLSKYAARNYEGSPSIIAGKVESSVYLKIQHFDQLNKKELGPNEVRGEFDLVLSYPQFDKFIENCQNALQYLENVDYDSEETEGFQFEQGCFIKDKILAFDPCWITPSDNDRDTTKQPKKGVIVYFNSDEVVVEAYLESFMNWLKFMINEFSLWQVQLALNCTALSVSSAEYFGSSSSAKTENDSEKSAPRQRSEVVGKGSAKSRFSGSRPSTPAPQPKDEEDLDKVMKTSSPTARNSDTSMDSLNDIDDDVL